MAFGRDRRGVTRRTALFEILNEPNGKLNPL
jgi:hypothetical protein